MSVGMSMLDYSIIKLYNTTQRGHLKWSLDVDGLAFREWRSMKDRAEVAGRCG